MDDDDFKLLVAALRDAVAGEGSGKPDLDLVAAAEKLIDRGLLPQFGRAAIEVLVRYNLAKLIARRTIVLCNLGRMH